MVKSVMSSISLLKNKGSTGGLQGTERTRSFQTKTSSLTERKNNIFLKPKMTERMASGWMTVWRLDEGAKAIPERAVKMVEATVQLGAISPRKAKMQIEALKGNTRS